jgi:hypothetical protein
LPQAALLKRQQQLETQNAKADQSLGSDDSITGAYNPLPARLAFTATLPTLPLRLISLLASLTSTPLTQ